MSRRTNPARTQLPLLLVKPPGRLGELQNHGRQSKPPLWTTMGGCHRRRQSPQLPSDRLLQNTPPQRLGRCLPESEAYCLQRTTTRARHGLLRCVDSYPVPTSLWAYACPADRQHSWSGVLLLFSFPLCQWQQNLPCLQNVITERIHLTGHMDDRGAHTAESRGSGELSA